ncbi:MAG: DUF1318 domain-containing protein [Desulfobacterium sp.]|nr:DUF1318 domain-containing protein [Desulfobacterium sp.]MBU3947756.1 YdbL family protein [Pseudomonadota bacterium]MBU4010047.1 YdbL family protein [Pseudomonadota bacterium]MBU4036434.1 YdbL family protein [Pseudomonadota bacterium]
MIAKNSPRIIILLMLILFTCSFSFALEAKDIKARMIERVPTIQALKSKGTVGENNQGYLEVMPESKASDSDKITVNDENSDRKAVYTAIGKQQGTDSTLVGKRRALQIIESAAAGEWLQDESGKWYKKI